MDLESFCRNMPKVELHAHINGSISNETMGKLLTKKNKQDDKKLMFKKGTRATLEDCFEMFRLIHQISDDTDSVYQITYDVIHDFEEDNVKYLELRTTPREVTSTGMTKETYIEAVLKAISDCHKESLDIIVRLLLAIDRRNGVHTAMETVKLAEKYRLSSKGIVVGIDLSGDPKVGDAREYIPVFKEARQKGLKMALHLCEVPALDETGEILALPPDRIGHGTCLHVEAGGREEFIDTVSQHKIPLELCLTSNLIGQTVPNLDNHQFKIWYDMNHPCVICTDDKGVFSTSLSEEYSLAARTFNLKHEDLWRLSRDSINYIFGDDSIKSLLFKEWDKCKETIQKKFNISLQ